MLSPAYNRGQVIWENLQAHIKDVFEKGENKTVVSVSGNTTDRMTTIDVELETEEQEDLVVYMQYKASVLNDCLQQEQPTQAKLLTKKRKRQPEPLVCSDERIKRIRLTTERKKEETVNSEDLFWVKSQRVSDVDFTQTKQCIVCETTLSLRCFYRKSVASKYDQPDVLYGTLKNICKSCLKRRSILIKNV